MFADVLWILLILGIKFKFFSLLQDACILYCFFDCVLISHSKNVIYITSIDLFLRPCLCYQLQSIEQNMYVLL